MKPSTFRSLCVRGHFVVVSIAIAGCPVVGSHSTVVPDIVHVSHLDAIGRIFSAGLSVGSMSEAYSDYVGAGHVIRQSPSAAIRVSPGSSVDFVISRGALVTGRTETFLLPGDVPLEMVYVERGTFMMGANLGEEGAASEEYPQHEVTLTQGFWMGKYELTKAQWAAVMGSAPWSGQDYVLDDPDSPACYLAWHSAQSFITELNKLTGKTFRLPTEAEWEYAARAGTTDRFYWGEDPTYTVGNDYAWWQNNAWNIGQQYAHITGLKMPNAWGLYDMIGNVWEWCDDTYRPDYYSSSPSVDPTGPAPDTLRVLRGGAVGSYGSYCRSAKRYNFDASFSSATIGFRLCL